MNLGLNAVLALFVLTPGMGALLGLYLGSNTGKLRQPPPGQGSFVNLAIVVGGALFAHAATAVAIAAADAAAPLGSWELINPYSVLLSTGSHQPTGVQIGWVLVVLSLQTFAMMMVVTRMAKADVAEGYWSGFLYGWLEGLVQDSADRGGTLYTTAFVVTDMHEGGRYVGYEGLLENLNVGPDKEITAISLTQANLFYIELSAGEVKRTEMARETPIRRIYFAGKEIKNVAFQVFEYLEEAAA